MKILKLCSQYVNFVSQKTVTQWNCVLRIVLVINLMGYPGINFKFKLLDIITDQILTIHHYY